MTESTGENRSVYRLRWVGYGLLIFALVDTIQLFIPPGFTNPIWELTTIGALVERVPVPLLGLALIFFGEYYDRLGIEKIPLKILSWLCLVVAILFLLLIPLTIIDTGRVDNINEADINRRAEQPLAQLKQIEDQINRSSPEELKTFAEQLNKLAEQNKLAVTIDPAKPEELKNQVITRINQQRTQIQNQVQTERGNRRQTLFKNSVKWSLGALISSVLFFILWRTTGWARR